MQRLSFLHIPKTAGTTLNALLDQHYHTEDILPRDFFGKNALHVTRTEFTQEKIDSFNRYHLIHGHFGGDILRDYLVGYRSMTVLREPSARILSLYNDWRTKSDENYARAIAPAKELIEIARTHSLADFLLCGHDLVERQFRDGQARQLASTLALLEPPDVQAACDRLDEFDLVGITEMLEPTIHLLTEMMGWAPIRDFASLNRSSGPLKPSDLDANTREIVHEFTQADQLVYRHAQRLLSTRLSESLADRRSPTPTAIEFQDSIPDEMVISTHDPIDGSGWHVREGEDLCWRWTGPERCSTMRVPLRAYQRYQVEVRIISVIADDILAGTHLMINGHSIYYKNLGVIDGHVILRGDIPAWMINTPTQSTFSIVVPRTMSHAEIQPETNDHRPKGLAITAVRFIRSS
ncbi:MAG: sulfotransferase family 2 domain-containing protein [Phycisphaerales bacterium]